MVGIGGDLVTVDFMAFEMATVEEASGGDQQEKGCHPATPLQLVIDLFGKAMRHMENKNISGTIKDMEDVKRQAMKAFKYAAGQGGPKIET